MRQLPPPGALEQPLKEDNTLAGTVRTKTAAAKTPEQSELERLGAEFPGGDVKSREGGRGKSLTYISIEGTLKRLNEVLGANWSVEGAKSELLKNENGGWTAWTQLYIEATVDGVTTRKYGVGAMTNSDPDMALKSALAEALKKAGHSLGIALYLWDENARKRAESRMKLAGQTDSEDALKRAVFAQAEQKLGRKPKTAAEVAEVFGIPAGALADKDSLVEILQGEGVL